MTALALTDAEVATWRRRFPILDRCTYLISNSLGAMPDTVPGSLAAFADDWATRGVRAWSERWLPEVRRVSDTLGSLIGAPPGSVVLHQNVAALTAILASGLVPTAERRRVVMAAGEWPSHRYLFDGLAQRGEVEVVRVPMTGTDPGTDAATLAEAIDERTLLVVVSHVDFATSTICDVAAVCAAARRFGAVSLVDGYHAVGHMPVDVMAIGCDAYVGGSVKWLCGGPGVGYAFVAPDAALRPAMVGWLGHARPFDFADTWEPAEGAAGLLGGTPSIPSIHSAREGYAVIAEVGPSRIRATSQRLTQHLVEGALDRGFPVPSPHDPSRRAGAVTIDVGARFAEVEAALAAHEVIVDARPGAGIRVGPHFFSIIEEIDRFLDALIDVTR